MRRNARDASGDEGGKERRNRRERAMGPRDGDFFAGLIAVDARLFRH